LTSALLAVQWSVSRPGRFTPGERASGTHWIGGWVRGPRAFLEILVETYYYNWYSYGLDGPGSISDSDFSLLHSVHTVPPRNFPLTHTHTHTILQRLRVGTGLAQSERTGGPGLDTWHRQEIVQFFTAPRLTLGPTQPPIQWVPGPLSPGVNWPAHEASVYFSVCRSVRPSVRL
jgi:hypothetical protein